MLCYESLHSLTPRTSDRCVHTPGTVQLCLTTLTWALSEELVSRDTLPDIYKHSNSYINVCSISYQLEGTAWSVLVRILFDFRTELLRRKIFSVKY